MGFEADLPGCRLIELTCHDDARGRLYPLDLRNLVGFDASRMFLIKAPEDPFGVRRGGHSNSTPQVLIAASGSVTFDLDAGVQKATVVLDHPGIALLIGAGVLNHMRDFAPGTLLIGLAAVPYAQTNYYPEPQPALFAAQETTR
ncbi:sugar 3,4-ketoisomerase [Tabrizicola sp. BL-A-41-H6]|uniref:sugar 3,4-ketoisomerase n=1 Tax=Tabrizicola sp. BL-A-41-H6 TaxID=3421107 RepID=UPI003D66B2A4